MQLSKLETLAKSGTIPEEQIDEGALDVARRLKAGMQAGYEKVKGAVKRADVGTTEGGEKHTGKEFESLCSIVVSRANTQGKQLFLELTRKNIEKEEFPQHFLELLKTNVAAMQAKYRRGKGLAYEVNEKSGTIAVFEDPHLVKRYKDPLAVFVMANPLPDSKGPFFRVTFDAALDKRTHALTRLVDGNIRPLHAHQVADASQAAAPAASGGKAAPAASSNADGSAPISGGKAAVQAAPAQAAPAEKPAAQAAAAPAQSTEQPAAKATAAPAQAPAEKPAGEQPAAQAPHDQVPLDAASMEKHLAALWARWAESGKNASPAMRQLIKKMWLDTGGVKAEAVQPKAELTALSEMARR